MSEEIQEKTMLSGQQDAEFPVQQSLVGKIKQWRLRLGERWAQLHPNQVIYTIALFLFFVADGDLDEPYSLVWFVGLLAFFGMARELWAIFIKVWESTFGRLILLLVYAAIANFTIAVASQKVNIVINADPTQLYHTLGVTTLLVLPLWLMIVSVVAMIVIFGFMQVLRLIGGVFVLMRIISRKSKPKEAFPKTFIIVRLILLLPVTTTMFNSLSWYGEQLNLPQTPGLSFSSSSGGMVNKQVAIMSLDFIENELKNENLSDQERKDLITAKLKLEEGFENNTNPTVAELTTLTNNQVLDNNKNETLPEQTAETSTDVYFLDNLIASFVYNYEAFKYSHCQKAPSERVVYISENDILVVTKDINTPTGFVFSTRSCIVAN